MYANRNIDRCDDGANVECVCANGKCVRHYILLNASVSFAIE